MRLYIVLKYPATRHLLITVGMGWGNNLFYNWRNTADTVLSKPS